MMRVLLLLLGAALGIAALWLFLRGEREDGDALSSAYARALAFYSNEANQDYRRARQVLLAHGEQLDESADYHLDMALIDLGEVNDPVQEQDRLEAGDPRYVELLQSARRHLERARALAPEDDAIAFNLARAYRRLAPHADDPDALLHAAERLVEPLASQEGPDAAALMLYGDLRDEFDDDRGAYEAYQAILDLGEDFVPDTIFRVAGFKAANALMRLPGRQEEGERRIAEWNEDHPDRPKVVEGALERGRYTHFRRLAPPPETRADARGMRWLRVTERAGVPPAGSPRFFMAPDLDGDCARDLVVQGRTGMRVLRNQRNGSFLDMTEEAGFPEGFPAAAAAVGDLDGDGRMDLVAGGPDGVRVFFNITPDDEPTRWRFAEAEAGRLLGPRAGEPATCLVLWDFDHDGDLDLFAGGASNRVWRTAVDRPPQGGVEFTMREMSADLGLRAPPADDALVADVENDHDLDLLVSGPEGGAWFQNLRQLAFRRRDLPAAGALEAGDVDNDLLEEYRIGSRVFDWTGAEFRDVGGRAALQDADGDGVLDADPLAGLEPRGEVLRAFATDLNRDGDRDLFVLTSEGLDLYVARPERPVAWLDIRPRGLRTNEMGIGTQVRLYAGDLRIGALCRDGQVEFGLGRRARVDAVILRWTNGVEQGVEGPRIQDCIEVEEREGEVDSCPFLYAFDGERWRFVTDCHSRTPLGLPYADGKYLPPQSDESVLVPGALLRPAAGLLRLDLAEELREVFYLDHVALRAVDCPPGVRPVLNEGFRVSAPPAFAVHGLDRLRPPLAARDHAGRDVLREVAARDGVHASVFEPLPGQFQGLAHPWSIELDFGDLPSGSRVLLVMDGWTEFPSASASIAASQCEHVAFRPPVLEVRGEDGAWRVAVPDPGFPAGKGKSVLVDLSGRLGADGRIRLSGTQRIHWDAFSVHVGPDAAVLLTALPLVSANHRFRGFGARVEGEFPWRYRHDVLDPFPRWDQVPGGMLTRYGDVKELLDSIDDRYPVLASGDAVELAFDASELPPLQEGWTRAYVFTTEGWVKDADMNQAVRESVLPLPFHGMSGYPYPETESHPRPDFVSEWFTRASRELTAR